MVLGRKDFSEQDAMPLKGAAYAQMAYGLPVKDRLNLLGLSACMTSTKASPVQSIGITTLGLVSLRAATVSRT